MNHQRRSELEAAYLATEFEVEFPSGSVKFKIGASSPPLLEMLAKAQFSSWGLITPFNPDSVVLSVEENRARLDKFCQELASLQVVCYVAYGHDPTGEWLAERGYLIGNLKLDDYRMLGIKWGQAAVVVGKDGGVPQLIWCSETVS